MIIFDRNVTHLVGVTVEHIKIPALYANARGKNAARATPIYQGVEVVVYHPGA